MYKIKRNQRFTHKRFTKNEKKKYVNDNKQREKTKEKMEKSKRYVDIGNKANQSYPFRKVSDNNNNEEQ